jgi:hypothetical protein
MPPEMAYENRGYGAFAALRFWLFSAMTNASSSACS